MISIQGFNLGGAFQKLKMIYSLIIAWYGLHFNVLNDLSCFQCNLGPAGDLSIWEFSGHDNYYILYDHFIGNTNCIHTIVFNLEDPQEVQLQQIRFWLNFLQSRIPPVEPLGKIFSILIL
jgi:hypothetical protein